MTTLTLNALFAISKTGLYQFWVSLTFLPIRLGSMQQYGPEVVRPDGHAQLFHTSEQVQRERYPPQLQGGFSRVLQGYRVATRCHQLLGDKGY